jgi:putative endonuclease
MDEFAYVYILANGFKRLYIGVTTNLQERIWEHKNHIYPGSFTARYNITQLVYFERYSLITTAIAREKELKGWLRIRKIALIVGENPTWKDLSAEWGKPLGPWSAEYEARVPERYRTLKGKPPSY